MPVKTGIFGGTFNPIHIGHLALANYLCEYGGLDEIWFLVSPQNPFKQNVELLDDKIRLEMVKAILVFVLPTLNSPFPALPIQLIH